MTSRVKAVLGRLFGLQGWDSSDPRQWPRYLVIRPLVVTAPASLGVLLGAIVATSVGGGDWMALVLMLVGGALGFAAGAWLWLGVVEAGERRA